MRHISSLANGVALGSAGLVMMSALSGCSSQEQREPQNRYLVIEQQANGKYIIVEEMPTEGPSRAIIREKDENGNPVERFMNEAEMKLLAEQEYKKVQEGTSETLSSSDSSAGMGLAGTILAVAAGSLLGNMIGNALMNNKNFASKSSSVNKSAYSRSAAAKASNASGKKSFFGSSTSSTSRTSTYGG
ncbi:hypothetical protein [Sulfurimonas sp.]|uniref:hypothetical protein n=1 Tax=Sulfurimonas sp. TaxID=2022749 RepID=UPI0025F9B081|nr:hypothetical protein [Sulfurimonas sp.]MCK9473832.1 hypothetical protein [Sulfurimonas sp.]MDD3506696.1 hypothetical protein [Sulfurimonas sp.]